MSHDVNFNLAFLQKRSIVMAIARSSRWPRETVKVVCRGIS
ncbi:hypothetical protein HanPSC8_Chr14g0626531 [Helianthus annuus]|nr:hypothetical protein HanPSC8_Chr14g0626531 [Helianthus annuus]